MVAFAATYTQAHGYAGSASIYLEVGFSVKNVYATVSASSDVDATMDITVYWISGSKIFSDSFSQSSAGETGMTCAGTVTMAACDFDVASSDGRWKKHLVAR